MNLLEIYLFGVLIAYMITPFLISRVGHSYTRHIQISDHHLPALLWMIAIPILIFLLIFGNPGNKR